MTDTFIIFHMIDDMQNDKRPKVLTDQERKKVDGIDYSYETSEAISLSFKQKRAIEDIYKRFIARGGLTCYPYYNKKIDENEYPIKSNLDSIEFVHIRGKLDKVSMEIEEMLQPGTYPVDKCIPAAKEAIKEYRAILNEVEQKDLLLFKDYFKKIRIYYEKLKTLK